MWSCDQDGSPLTMGAAAGMAAIAMQDPDSQSQKQRRSAFDEHTMLGQRRPQGKGNVGDVKYVGRRR